VPVAAYAQLHGARLHLSGLVGSASDGRMARAQDKAASDAPEALGQAVARELLAQGAGEFL
jgi:hydroxymethylbilane synthase